MRYAQSTLSVIFVLCAGCSVAQADFTFYQFTGTLPVDPNLVTITGDMDGKVRPGETWTARFKVELDTPDSAANDSTYGFYDNAPSTGSIVFSGGFEATLTAPFSLADVAVYNGFSYPELGWLDPADGVSTEVQLSSGEYLWASVLTYDLTKVLTDEMPPPPESVANDVSDGWTVLEYISPTGGRVTYSSTDDGLFTVVPEPGTMALWSIALLGCLAFARRRAKRG